MLSILIVEDDITFSLMLTTWLGKKGFVVRSSSSVSDAKRRLGEEAFDLVISDLRLPDSDGIDLLKWLKSTHPSLPLIMMTSYAEIQTAVQAMKLGAADYIAKPLNPDELLGKIKELVHVEEKAPARVPVSSAPDLYIEGQSQAARQVQLLRALQERKVKPIGSNQEIAINVRLISATNENLRQAIEKGDFREDLYHRINEFTIRIPDLKERKEDLLLFANHFLDLANSELQKDIIGFDNDTMQLFQSYSWPGNLRQMKNVIKYATLLATGRYITRKELPEELTENLSSHTNIQLKNVEHERDLIRKALQECGNNKTRAAQLLGIDRKTLYNKLKIYQLD